MGLDRLGDVEKIDRFVNLLDEFQRLPPRHERLPTFMEVAGCAHKENEHSNILAFFFDPQKPHGLGTLFLDAIARIDGIQHEGRTIGRNVSIDREKTTDAGKRIDILIQSDSHVILIENKIFAGIDNPLDHYAAYIKDISQGRTQDLFLLTLTPNSAGDAHGFKNITHRQFVKEIRGLLGHYVACANTHYCMFMLDFLNTLDYLEADTIMDQAFLDFLESHRGNVEVFLKEINTLKGELRAKVRKLADLIDVSSYSNVRQWLWRGQEAPLDDVLVHDIELAPFVVAVGTSFGPSSCKVHIFPRGKEDNACIREKVRKLLQDSEIQFKEDPDHNDRFMATGLEDTTNLDQISKFVRDVVFKLANGNGAPASPDDRTNGQGS